MTVKEAIALLGYGTSYEIRGAFSGKIYYRSFINSSKTLDKYANETVSEAPFYSTMTIRGKDTCNSWCMPVVGIWMKDYLLTKEGKQE